MDTRLLKEKNQLQPEVSGPVIAARTIEKMSLGAGGAQQKRLATAIGDDDEKG
jgi:hypothetical protein